VSHSYFSLSSSLISLPCQLLSPSFPNPLSRLKSAYPEGKVGTCLGICVHYNIKYASHIIMYFSKNNVHERFSHQIVRIVAHLSLKAHGIHVGFVRITRQRCFTTHKPHAGRPVDNALDRAACSRWDHSIATGG